MDSTRLEFPEWETKDHRDLHEYKLTEFEKAHVTTHKERTMSDQTPNGNPNPETTEKHGYPGMAVVIFQGRMARDPEVRMTGTSNRFQATLTIAVDDGKDGAQFMRVLTFDKPAENHASYLEKGQMVTIMADLRPDRKVTCFCRKCHEKQEFDINNHWVLFPFRVYYGPKAQQKVLTTSPAEDKVDEIAPEATVAAAGDA